MLDPNLTLAEAEAAVADAPISFEARIEADAKLVLFFRTVYARMAAGVREGYLDKSSGWLSISDTGKGREFRQFMKSRARGMGEIGMLDWMYGELESGTLSGEIEAICTELLGNALEHGCDFDSGENVHVLGRRFAFEGAVMMQIVQPKPFDIHEKRRQTLSRSNAYPEPPFYQYFGQIRGKGLHVADKSKMVRVNSVRLEDGRTSVLVLGDWRV